MPTECNPEPMLFARLDRREVVADFFALHASLPTAPAASKQA